MLEESEISESVDKSWLTKSVEDQATCPAPAPVADQPEKTPGSRGAYIRSFNPHKMHGYLRVLMRKQPLLRTDWETWDFYQELSIRFISRLAKHGLDQIAEDHRAAIVRRMAWQLSKDKLRQIQRAKRDCRRTRNHVMNGIPEAEGYEDPLISMCDRETLRRIREALPPLDWSLLEMRASGMSWEEIAQKHGGTASCQRMRHKRLIQKLATQHP